MKSTGGYGTDLDAVVDDALDLELVLVVGVVLSQVAELLVNINQLIISRPSLNKYSYISIGMYSYVNLPNN